MINLIAQKYIDRIEEACKRIKPKVAIHSLTYNHEPYIKEALDSFLMQKTDFPFIAIVHEDASTDGTAGILREYAEKYPDIIFPIFEKENQYSKKDGVLNTIMTEAVKVSGADYVAMCECDDYWTDANKLQKQVDYLDNHLDIVYTCHNYYILRNGNEISNKYKLNSSDEIGTRFCLYDAFMKEWFTKTLTCVFRSREYLNINLNKYPSARDIHLVYELLKQGDGYYFKFYGGIYREQPGGVCSPLSPLEKNYQYYKFWEYIYKLEKTKTAKVILVNAYIRVISCNFKYNRKLALFKSPIRIIAVTRLPHYLISTIYRKIKNKVRRQSINHP